MTQCTESRFIGAGKTADPFSQYTRGLHETRLFTDK